MKNLFKNYGLTITLLVLFLISWSLQGINQWTEFQNTQKEHNQPIKFEQFMPEFWSATFENWQSEFLQLLTFVVLTSFLIHKGSHESKDSDEEMKQILLRIEKRLSNSK